MPRGGCACGAVRYETAGEPFHRTLCHCVDCRRAAGAPAVAWFSVPAAALRFVKGTPATHRSSPTVERSFCGACGTPLAYRNDAYPEEVDVTTCSLDDPAAASPRDHTFASQRLPWMRVDDGLPVFPRSRGEGPAPC
ncbi:GFA family protein [Massilia aerilata]|uniref:GFA family protein n=1 Tax=Massilia aerilata TaxID=453817 RepID=A0ABW0RS97_9BURK